MSKAQDAIAAATGRTPTLWRPAGRLTDDAVNAVAARTALAGVLWDVIPFDWINDSNIAATRYMLMTQIKPGSVVLLRDSYSSTVDLVEQFIPVLKANGYHLVTVSQLLGDRAPGSVCGGRDNGPPVNLLKDISGRGHFRRCRPPRRRPPCRTSRSPTSPAPTAAAPTTASGARVHETTPLVLAVLVLGYALVSQKVDRSFVAPALIFMLLGMALGPSVLHLLDAGPGTEGYTTLAPAGPHGHPCSTRPPT